MTPTEAPSKLTILPQAIMAEGLQLLDMAKSIPRLQKFDGMSFELFSHHHHYFTCHHFDMVAYLSQRKSLSELSLGGQVHPFTLIMREFRYGAPSRVLNAVKILIALTISACVRFLCLFAVCRVT